jgi:hypothetical protein
VVMGWGDGDGYRMEWMADLGGCRITCRNRLDRRTRASRLLLLPKRSTPYDVRHDNCGKRWKDECRWKLEGVGIQQRQGWRGCGHPRRVAVTLHHQRSELETTERSASNMEKTLHCLVKRAKLSTRPPPSTLLIEGPPTPSREPFGCAS